MWLEHLLPSRVQVPGKAHASVASPYPVWRRLLEAVKNGPYLRIYWKILSSAQAVKNFSAGIGADCCWGESGVKGNLNHKQEDVLIESKNIILLNIFNCIVCVSRGREGWRNQRQKTIKLLEWGCSSCMEKKHSSVWQIITKIYCEEGKKLGCNMVARWGGEKGVRKKGFPYRFLHYYKLLLLNHQAKLSVMWREQKKNLYYKK